MSEPSLPGTPGTGDIPEPEDPDQRERIIEDAEQRRKDQADALADRSAEAKEFYSGGAAEAEDDKPAPRSTSTPPPPPPH